MAYHLIKNNFEDQRFVFIAPFGLTICVDGRKPHEVDEPKYSKVKDALAVVGNPFAVNKSEIAQENNSHSWLLKTYAKLLVFCYRYCYFLVYLISFLRLGIFENSTTAMDYFCSVYPGEQQAQLCLPRSIFAATTSKRFKQHGCMFIGVFLPSTSMHAWIVEDGHITYRHDYYWIHFTPIAVMI